MKCPRCGFTMFKTSISTNEDGRIEDYDIWKCRDCFVELPYETKELEKDLELKNKVNKLIE